MSYDHKDKVQRESSDILKKSGRIQVSKHLWVTREIAESQYGYRDWVTEEREKGEQYQKDCEAYNQLSFFKKLFTKKPKR